jgi:hypothetical protein
VGLDIKSFEHVKLWRPEPASGWAVADISEMRRRNATVLSIVPAFEAYADGLVSGMYEVSGHTISVHVGPYDDYNDFRSMLAELVGTSMQSLLAIPVPGPFVELIVNSDCEGTIGHRTSAKLAKDFAEWRARAVSYASEADPDGDERFLSLYDQLHRALDMAGVDGALCLG